MGRPLSESLPHGGSRSWQYDVRGNLTRFADADGRVWTWQYDGLDRRLAEQAPGGVDLSHTYDQASRPLTYTDALGNQTRWVYDILGRRTDWLLNGVGVEIYGHDESGNPTSILRADGSRIDQSFDAAGRLISRQINLPDGTLGEAESYAHDALGRITQQTAGGISTQHSFDSLSRLTAETTAGLTVGYQHDAAGNLIQITYPSGRRVDIVPDGLNRPSTVAWAAPGPPEVKVRYGYRGGNLMSSRSLAQLTGVKTFDAGRRTAGWQVQDAGNQLLLGESLTWTPGSRLATATRTDLGGLTRRYGYQDGRLISAIQTGGPASSTPATTGWADIPESFTYSYDRAQNLLGMDFAQSCAATQVALPLDASGWNRPASVAGEALQWTARQELASKGNFNFTYSWDHRPIELRRNGVTIASYKYDSQGRRVERKVGADTYTTVWSGWQPIEEYKNGLLHSRRTYGVGLDELIRLESDLDGDGVLEQEYLPFYDTIGNLVLLTNEAGKPIERYAYGPYGRQWIVADSTAPVVEQIRMKGDELWLELSEEVRLDRLQAAASAGTLTLVNALGEEISLQIEQPVDSGRAARRRVVLSELPSQNPSRWPAAGEIATLTIPAGALVDLFENKGAAVAEAMTWPAIADEIHSDTAPPQLLQACVTPQRKVELEFSEPLDEATLNTIQLNSVATTWTVSADGYRLTSGALAVGSNTLLVDGELKDLAGTSLAGTVSESFIVSQGQGSIIHSAPYPGQISTSATGNPFGFKGLPRDPESGLIYVRNRYYDPEMGRWITSDPLGLVDGPGQYAFVGGDPVNFGDPMGLFNVGLGPCGAVVDAERRAECLAKSRLGAQQFDQAVTTALANPYVQGSLQVIGGCTEAIVGGAAVLSGVGALPGGLALAHGTDLCGTGIITLIVGETQETLFYQGATAGLVATGVDPYYAGWVAAGLDIGAGVGASWAVGRSFARAGGRTNRIVAETAGKARARKSHIPNHKRGIVGNIELDKYINALGMYEHGSPNIIINRGKIVRGARAFNLSPRDILYETVYHESFHRGLFPFRKRIGSILGTQDPYSSSRVYRLTEEWLAEMYGVSRASVRAGKGPITSWQSLVRANRKWWDETRQFYMD